MKRLFKNRKILYFTLSITMVLIFTLTVAYAALNTVLKITGSAEVSSADWNIHLDNVQLINGSVGNSPTITHKDTVEFSLELSNPGDYYMFTVDVVNNGSIDAMIESIEKKPELSVSQAKYLNYIVEYQSGESINTKQLVEKNSFVRLKVKVEFRKDLVASDLPSTTETLDLSFTVKYTQADEDGTSSITNSGKLVKVVSGNYDTIGSEICIGSECFYVISSTDEDVTMLSKYNLYVGSSCTADDSCTPYSDEATGMQDSTMLGRVYTTELRKGTTAFSSDEQKGTKYSDYEGSIVEGYVKNYKALIEDFDIKIKEARLITKNELMNKDTFACNESCSTEYPWVYSCSYWVGSSIGDSILYYVLSNSGFNGAYYYDYDYFGVRPVITISKSEF